MVPVNWLLLRRLKVRSFYELLVLSPLSKVQEGSYSMVKEVRWLNSVGMGPVNPFPVASLDERRRRKQRSKEEGEKEESGRTYMTPKLRLVPNSVGIVPFKLLPPRYLQRREGVDWNSLFLCLFPLRRREKKKGYRSQIVSLPYSVGIDPSKPFV